MAIKKGKQIIVKISTKGNEPLSVAAYCLATDSWEDYLHFRADATDAFRKSDKRRGNRSLRAALLLLFSHLEGVVNSICAEKKFPRKITNGSLRDRINKIHIEAKKCANISDINFRLDKHIRDILAHPGIEKTFENDEKIDEVAVYDKLTLESLEQIGTMIDNWLNSVCRALQLERFTDTTKMLDDFCSAIGSTTIESKEV